MVVAAVVVAAVVWRVFSRVFLLACVRAGFGAGVRRTPQLLRCPMVDRAPQYATRGRFTRRGSHCYCYVREYGCDTAKLLRGLTGGKEEAVVAISAIKSTTAATVIVAGPVPMRTATVVF